MADPGKFKEILKDIALVALVVLLVAGVVWFVRSRTVGKKAAVPEETQSVVGRLEGIYTIRTDEEDISLTGQVSRITADKYQIYVVTEYGPRYYTFSLAGGNDLVSEELGAGKVEYNSNLDLIKITFNDEGSVCVLSK